MPQNEDQTNETTTEPRLLRRQRRFFRRLTEEERAARFKRIMELLNFLFQAIPTLTVPMKAIAFDQVEALQVDLANVMVPLPNEDIIPEGWDEEEVA
jgi:hypothetical protein